MRGKRAKATFYVLIVISLLIMLPAIFIYGVRTVPLHDTSGTSAVGCTCYIKDADYLGTWHVVFRGFQFLLNFTLFIFISLAYVMVYKTVHQRMRAPSTPRLQSPSTLQAGSRGVELLRQRSSGRGKISPAPQNVPVNKIETRDTGRRPSLSSVSSVELNMQIRELARNTKKNAAQLEKPEFTGTNNTPESRRKSLFSCCVAQKNRRESRLSVVTHINVADFSAHQQHVGHRPNFSPTPGPSTKEAFNTLPVILMERPKHLSPLSVVTSRSRTLENRKRTEEDNFTSFNSGMSQSHPDRPSPGPPSSQNRKVQSENNLGSPAQVKNRYRNRLHLTIPVEERHSVYQAGLKVGKMRQISFPGKSSTLRRTSSEETTAYMSEAAISHYQRTRYRTAMILLTVTIVFLLTWLPFWILCLVAYIDQDFWETQTYAEQNVFRILRYLYMVNHAVNPVIYAFAHKQFREDLKLVSKKLLCTK